MDDSNHGFYQPPPTATQAQQGNPIRQFNPSQYVNNSNQNSNYSNYNAGMMNTASTSSSSSMFSTFTSLFASPSSQPNYDSYSDESMQMSFENEPPLLEELGINFEHIYMKTRAVLLINKSLASTFTSSSPSSSAAIDPYILDDTDLAGPITFCLLLGSILLLSGKVHFGYIYGFSVCGCLAIMMIINLLLKEEPGANQYNNEFNVNNSNITSTKFSVNSTSLDLWQSFSILGYCLLPVIFLSFFNLFLNLRGLFGLLLAISSILWSTYAATRLVF